MIRLSKHDISDSYDEFLLIGDQASSPVVEQSSTTEAPDTVELQEYDVLLIDGRQMTLHLDEGGDVVT